MYNKGFTLLEVLVALVILSVSLTAIIMLLQQNGRNLTHMKQVTAANWVAMNVINEAQLGIIDISHAHRQGVQRMLGTDWYWNMDINSTGNPYVKELSVKVSEKQSGKFVYQMLGFIDE